MIKYVRSILTAHVVKTPPDLEAGLSEVLKLRGQQTCHSACSQDCTPMSCFTGMNRDIVDDAVKYIIFLVDVNRLFDTALGMYDFSLVLLVAQYSQKVCLSSYSSPSLKIQSGY